MKKWLVAHGVADNRLKPKGYGETVPVGDKRAAQGSRAQRIPAPGVRDALFSPLRFAVR